VKTATKTKNEWFDFQLQLSPTMLRRVVAFDKPKQPTMKHFQETKSPVLVKNLVPV